MTVPSRALEDYCRESGPPNRPAGPGVTLTDDKVAETPTMASISSYVRRSHLCQTTIPVVVVDGPVIRAGDDAVLGFRA